MMPEKEQIVIFLNYLKGISYQNDATKELIKKYEDQLEATEEEDIGEAIVDEGSISIAEAE